MTDTITPGSKWLLPVTISDLKTAKYGFLAARGPGRQKFRIDHPDALIPASRLADLEAEVARLQAHVDKFEQLYEDARHDLTKAEGEVERLRDELRQTLEQIAQPTALSRVTIAALNIKRDGG